MTAGRHNGSSIDGGIFAEAPVVASPRRARHISQSSMPGGIFGSDQPSPEPKLQRNFISKSSVEGGLFPMDCPLAHNDENFRPQSARANPANTVAGVSTVREASSEVLRSVRPDRNASSVQGGIFGAPTSATKMSSRTDCNRSSIEGGIFG